MNRFLKRIRNKLLGDPCKKCIFVTGGKWFDDEKYKDLNPIEREQAIRRDSFESSGLLYFPMQPSGSAILEMLIHAQPLDFPQGQIAVLNLSEESESEE